MTSNQQHQYKEAYVWIWLPGETKPVVAGRLEASDSKLLFNYGKSYIDRMYAIPIYKPELPLQAGAIPLLSGLSMPSCLRDAAPDAWGRRVIINKKLGHKGKDIDPINLDELTYLLESGSDRIGALDFQLSPTEYVPRSASNASLEELLEAAKRVEQGVPLTPELEQALFHGSSIGGARPKALIEDNAIKYIAKFSSTSDEYEVVKGEFIAMRLAALAGINVAPVKLVRAAGKDILLVERFDRVYAGDDWQRKSMVSALTILGLDEMMARYASYESLAEEIRKRFMYPKDTLIELFARMAFNILTGNTDDHARNHAAFWDGEYLTLTPAYDICPQGRSGNEASQAMQISSGIKLSQVVNCLHAAHHFHLSEMEARNIIDGMITVINDNWSSVCEEAELSEVGKKFFWRRQFLNPFSMYGWT